MITPVSFGSTFEITSKPYYSQEQKKNLKKIPQFCEDNNIPYERPCWWYKDSSGHISCISSILISVPDEDDKKITDYLAQNELTAAQIKTKYALQNIESRIEKPKSKNFRIAYADTEKLDKLLTTRQDSNFTHCEADYNKYYKEQTNLMLNAFNDNIIPSTLYITPWSTKDEAVNYINKFGSGNLNENTISFNLVQRTDKPDHCMYFAMKEAGMKIIPVYVDNDSCEIGQALGIFNTKITPFI